jgi:hypothetical protein
MLAFSGILAFTFNVSAQDGSTSAKCGFQKFTINAPAGTTATPTDLNDNGCVVGLLGPDRFRSVRKEPTQTPTYPRTPQ